MEEIDIAIWCEQGKQNLREYQKYYCKAKKISLQKLYFLYIVEKMSKAI